MTLLKVNSSTPDTTGNAAVNGVEEAIEPSVANNMSVEAVGNLLRNTYSSVQELGPAFIVATEGDPVLVYQNDKGSWDVVPFRITGKQGVLNEDGKY